MKNMENISGTIDKTLNILEIFLSQDGEIGLTEIAELSGYNNATVHEKKNGKYSLGVKTLEFCFKVRCNLHYLDIVFLHLSKLCQEQKVNVNLTVLDSDDQIVIDEIGIESDIRLTAPIGKRLPLHATACGKVFLAYMSEDERKSFFNRNPLVPITKNTITDVDRLTSELEIIKRDGLAIDEGQYILGAWAVSAPVFNGKGDIACAATIVLPMSQVNTLRARECASALSKYTTELSDALSRSS
jgi:DNA-binding IclR family transcriptional regulator